MVFPLLGRRECPMYIILDKQGKLVARVKGEVSIFIEITALIRGWKIHKLMEKS